MRALALVVCVLLAAPAAAVDAVVANARRATLQGREAFSAGRYEDAERFFLDAYNLVPEPALLYNLARCRAALGRDLEAAETYERFSTLTPDPQDRREAEAMAIEARRRAAVRAPVAVRHARYIAPAATALGAVALALGAAGLGTGLAAQARHDDLDRLCAAGCPADAAEEARTGERLRIASIATLAIGGAAVIAGTVAFAIEWRRRR
jgi:tetratricopeptide (TPR) repeat protein